MILKVVLVLFIESSRLLWAEKKSFVVMECVLCEECLNLYTYMDQVWADFHTCPCLRTVLLPSHFRWMMTKS